MTKFMNVRLKKEFQGLFWPWLVAMLLGLLPVLSLILPGGMFELATRSIYLISGAGFVLGIALLAAMPLGDELNLRTLPMLLAQPCDRLQIWREKHRIALLLIGSVALVHLVGYLPYWNMLHDVWRMALAFLIFSLCSGAFWVLLTRSTIGGTVFCLFCQAAIMLLVSIYTQKKHYALDEWKINLETAHLLLNTSLILSPAFLWLGWRLFGRFQALGNWENETTSTDHQASEPRSWPSWLRINAFSPNRNLWLKELRLYKPIFIMAFLFACLWVATVLACELTPERQKIFTNFLNGITCIFSPVILLISGCLSLSEEKTFGLHQFNLTLPISFKNQFLLKLTVASSIGLAVGLLFPISLVALESHIATKVLATWVKSISQEKSALVVLALVFFLIPSISFWAATVLTRTTQAVFLAGLSLICIVTFHSLGKNLTASFLTGFVPWIVDWITAAWQLPLGWAYTYQLHVLFLSYASIGLLFPFLCWRCYRLQQATRAQVLKHILVFSVAAFIGGVIFNDIRQYSGYREGSRLYTETQSALRAIGADDLSANTNWICESSVLSQTGRLSAQTALWLRGSTFRISQVKTSLAKGQDITAVIQFNVSRPLGGQIFMPVREFSKQPPQKTK